MINEPGLIRPKAWARGALVGAGLWVTWGLAVRPEWTAVLLLLAPFVLVPLGLRVAMGADTGPDVIAAHRLGYLAPVPATSAAAGFLPGPGVLAALLTVPWLAFTLSVAWVGVVRLLSRRTLADPAVGTEAGLVFVAVGGAWLTISRAGLNPLGFSDAIVQLTAVHFHYAGFALPIVAGFTARRLNRSVLIPLAVVLGVPLTAVGITYGGWLEWIGATVMALAGIGTAGLLLQLGAARETRRARWLIGAAGLALLAGMGFALQWAWSIRFGWGFRGLDSMAATHGSLNALGFGVLGLVGLNVLSAAPRADAGETTVHLGRPRTDALQRLAAHAVDRPTTNAVGLLRRPTPGGFRRKTWQRQIEHGDFGAASDAIRLWRGHQAAGIRLSPPRPRIAVGETLALAIPVGPISISATCRIVEVVDEPDRYGFTYSTLAHHAVDGEESFIASRDEDGIVEVVVTAVWRPATIANHVCPPLTRYLQNRAINRYLDGIAHNADCARDLERALE